MERTAAVIRRYRDADLSAVYDVCVRTADAGADARGMYRSDDLMPDLFAGPDTATFVRAYRARWIPRLAGRYPVPSPETGRAPAEPKDPPRPGDLEDEMITRPLEPTPRT
jgi:hypothetical protein